MRIGVLKEVAPREHRVALTPEAVAKLIKAGATVVIERGAGDAAYCPDAAYVAVGACLLYTSPSPRDRTRVRMPSSV